MEPNTIINVADIVNPESGLTFRQENQRKTHALPIGAIVECLPYGEGDDDYNEYTGLRLFVVGHDRDCDGTPLYSLSCQPVQECEKLKKFADRCTVFVDNLSIRGSLLMHGHRISGMAEESLKLIYPPKQPKEG